MDLFPAIPVGFLDSSLLLHALADLFLHVSDKVGSGLIGDLSDVLSGGGSLSSAAPGGVSSAAGGVSSSVGLLTPIHPLVAVGITGILTNALNFLPIGRLDGGRVVMAVGGRRTASSISFAALIAQAVSFLSTSSPVMLFWSVFVVLFQRSADLPPLDDVTPVATNDDDANKGLPWLARAAALLMCVSLTSLAILPVPIDPSVQQQQQQQLQQQQQQQSIMTAPQAQGGASDKMPLTDLGRGGSAARGIFRGMANGGADVSGGASVGPSAVQIQQALRERADPSLRDQNQIQKKDVAVDQSNRQPPVI